MNPFLKRLGYDENARVVILHADDIGMCQASVDAYADLLEAGIMSSAATMVPCPWFSAAAQVFKRQSENPRYDVGVHLTLNSEWDGFRWGALSTREAATGMFDADGNFHSRSEPTQEYADPDAVERELTAQIERALAAGVDVTHVDTHMFTLFHTRLLPAYIRAAERFRLPAFLPRPGNPWLPEISPETEELILEAEARGMPLFDYFDALDLDKHTRRVQEGTRALEGLGPGLSVIVFHPCRDTPETRAMASDWRCRAADYRLFLNEAWREIVAAAGVRVIGYRELREAMRQS